MFLTGNFFSDKIVAMTPEGQDQGRYTFREAMSNHDVPFNSQEKAMIALGVVTSIPATLVGSGIEFMNQFSNNNQAINMELILAHGVGMGAGFGAVMTTMCVGIVAANRGWLVSRASGLRESDDFRFFHPKKN